MCHQTSHEKEIAFHSEHQKYFLPEIEGMDGIPAAKHHPQ
ncbi:hypothetical protein HMPREF9337_02289 [Cutibacterium acnes HL096PA3]|nr:hypothetical protein HMPREF9587_00816 [Cutibacterium acnes HL025PA1]EFS55897.1 hypothetical protein HMPREF9593_01697 [Cutibacterium acnes HL046PA2]EFS58755.1 hypothetical protein HMPREF9604_01387 [Cutibacterium acnes HL036PA1]EFS61795.1 hypothetical protein HMPREF9605_00756 [Cutibacterium acnes HL036PA2]EFS64887.1 hypothetical protein HMPREF9611_00175 [Cutibacterium acnes HL063PA1]EFS69373.1 hypothetical protein HMPREF9616_00977 [Cutibacterium acnes HL007PA1]EFS72527.1 hypothetical protein